MTIIEKNTLEVDGYEKTYFIVETKDKRIEVEKVVKLINSEDYLDKDGKFDTESLIEDIENKRIYNVTITKLGDKVINKECDCKWGTLENMRNTKTGIDCHHIKECIEVLK